MTTSARDFDMIISPVPFKPLLKNLRSPAVMAGVLFVLSLASGPAQAQTCQQILQGHADWATSQPEGGGDYKLQVTLVSDSNDAWNGSQVATFAEGELKFKPLPYGGMVFHGIVQEVFSNRRWSPATAPGGFTDEYPFDPDNPENLSITLNHATGEALLSRGSWRRTVTLQCSQNLMYGAALPSNFSLAAKPIYVFGFKRVFSAPPE